MKSMAYSLASRIPGPAAVAALLLLAVGLAYGGSGTHPRIFMTPEEVRTARERGALTDVQKILRGAVLARAEESLVTPLRYTEPGNPDLLLSHFRVWPTVKDSEMLLIRKDARDTDALALAYAITGDRKYAEQAWDNVRVMLTTYKAFGSYHPHRENNDLAAAHAFMALATTWDLCADAAPEKVRKLVLTEGVRRARFMYNTAVSDWRINGLPVPFETPGVPNTKEPYNRNIFAMLTTNHCWVDVGLLGCLALALEEEDVSGAGPGSGPKDWLRFAEHFFDYIAGIMPPDGSWPESRVYGAPYAFEGPTQFLRALKRTKGIDILSRNPFFHNFAYGRLYAVWNHPGHGGIANFGEGWNGEWQSAAWIYAIAAEFRDPALQWSADCWTRRHPSTDEPAWQYLDYDPALPALRPDSAGLPRAILLGDMSHIHVRGGSDPWGVEERVLSFRGAIAGRRQYELQAQGKLPYVETWHMHLSRNAVQLAVKGSPLITKATDFEDGTRFYSVLEVNGRDQSKSVDYEGGLQDEIPGRIKDRGKTSSRGALPGVSDFEATAAYVTFSNEIGAAYPDLETYRRRIVCLEPDLYIIADHAKAAQPVQMDFRLHFGSRSGAEFHPAAEDAPARVTGSLEGAPFSCEIISTGALSASLGEPAKEEAPLTLRYGPPDRSSEMQVMAIIRLGDIRGPARAVKSEQRNLAGVFIGDRGRALAVLIVDSGSPGGEPGGARYVVSKSTGPTRHLVAGLAGSGRYTVRAEVTENGVAVAVLPGKGLTASPQGSLFFDIAPDGRIVPVQTPALPSAQEVAADITGRRY